MRTIALLFLTTVFLSSCTIQKRTHLSGFHVTWNKHYKSSSSIKNQDKIDVNRVQIADQELASDPKQRLEFETISPERTLDKKDITDHLDSETELNAKPKSSSTQNTSSTTQSKVDIETKTDPRKKVYSQTPTLKRSTREAARKSRVPVEITGFNAIDWILEIFLWLIGGFVGILSALVLFLIASYWTLDDNESDYNRNQKTAKSVFLRSFNILCRTFVVIYWIALIAILLIALAVFVYKEAGLVGVFALILLLLLLLLLLNWIADGISDFFYSVL